MSPRFDVVVVGGGPAGAALAGSCARRGRTVALFERGAFEGTRTGESLGPEVKPLLEELGAWGALGHVLGQGGVPFRAVRSAWGSDELVERSSIFHPLGEGWHVDRARFDEALARWAESCGARLTLGAGACDVARDGEGFVVRPAHGDAARGAFFVDASGQGAPAGRRLGERRWLACDRQVALSCIMSGGGDPGTDLLLETVEEGWWYSAPQPGGRLAVALVTDADLVPAGPRDAVGERFARALERSVHTAERVKDLGQRGPVRVVRAGTGCLVPITGSRWRAIGDAARSVDPLAGSGVARALRSALEAGRSVGEGQAGVALASDIEKRGSYYDLEGRWPDALFWSRRRAGRWKTLAITLDPRTPLDPPLAHPPRDVLAPAEALLPPVAVAAALTGAPAEPAHRVLDRMRAVAPVGDRRLLAGLQLLLDRGALRATHPGPRPADRREVGGEHVVIGDARRGDDLGGGHR